MNEIKQSRKVFEYWNAHFSKHYEHYIDSVHYFEKLELNSEKYDTDGEWGYYKVPIPETYLNALSSEIGKSGFYKYAVVYHEKDICIVEFNCGSTYITYCSNTNAFRKYQFSARNRNLNGSFKDMHQLRDHWFYAY